jgi:hypothetical protein
MSSLSGADLKYRALLAQAGVSEGDSANHDGAFLEQLAMEVLAGTGGSGPSLFGLQVFNVMAPQYGAVGDGTTNDSPAFLAARTDAIDAGGGIVYAPWTIAGYLIEATIPFADNVFFQGSRYVKIKRGGAASAAFFNAPSGVEESGISGFTIEDSLGISTSAAVRAATGSKHIYIEDNHFVNTSNPTPLVPASVINVQTSTTDIYIRNNKFTDCYGNLVRVDGNCKNLYIDGNKVDRWKERCFYFVGTAIAACENVWITNNEIANLVSGGISRQAITVQGNDAFVHTNINIWGNTIKGPGVSYDDAIFAGTADQISVHRCKGFKILFNTTTDGGDVGITVAMQCSNGIVGFNQVLRNDSYGICIGSTTTTFTKHINVVGNNCMDNGQARTVVRTNRTGLMFNNASQCLVSSNMLGNDDAVAKQEWAMVFVDSNNISLGVNHYIGNTLGQHKFSGVTTAIGSSFNGSAPVTKPTGVAVTAAAIHAALVNAGIIGA